MKIAFFEVTAGKREGGGIETYCWELGKTLVQRGHQVVILSCENGHIRNKSVDYEGYPFRSRRAFPDLGRFPKLMERLSFASSALPRLLSGEYDLVVINKPTDFPAMWWAKRRGLKAKVAFCSGGRDFWLGDKFFAGSVDIWISCSNSNALQISKRYGREVNTVYNGVDIDLFSPGEPSTVLQNALGLPEDSQVIISVSRLVRWKGLDVVIRALAEVTDIYYLVIGDGPVRSELEVLAKKAGVEERVIFTGIVNNKEIVNYYRLADLLVQPSKGMESFSITLLEAMACGLPVLATAKKGMEESVIDNETGKLLNSHDPKLWSSAIQELFENKAELKSMGKKAREWTQDNFTWSINAEHLEALIKSDNTKEWNEIYNSDFYKSLAEKQKVYSAEKVLSSVVKNLKLTLNSAVDVGCGSGTWLNVLKKQEKLENVKGIDGQWVDRNFLMIPDEDFIEADLSKTFPKLSEKFDLAISLEVAEHLPPERAKSFIDYLTNLSDMVLFSAATPFQGGKNHLNEQWQSYWTELFKKQGFAAFDIVRPEIWNDQKVHCYYKQNTILYIHKNKVPEVNLPCVPSEKLMLSLLHPDMYQKFINPSTKRLFWRGTVRRALTRSIRRIFGCLAK